ncbi:RagB/SusD family nutrient uptake outer membrane protein [Pseudoflavitalea rhizosphaerae]|uniref:RagB/SusD family nutrient uptake outer membrane protein n=1 Tax=Pseudoflavitalea rhizosphaerae TaxID=1884793 RepID=UPI000F8DFE5A|nr:RagB/SusD family nutrient uptake outer membrane protein [Pseudoflavitalea rhizosphaerae]
MFRFIKKIAVVFIGLLCCLCSFSCKKLLEVQDPINSITTKDVFSSDDQAEMAAAAMYSLMVNSDNYFSNGGVSIAGGLSADELYAYYGAVSASYFQVNTNNLLADNVPTKEIWVSAYNIIYQANSIIEGIEESEASTLSAHARKRLTGEAKFIRAFSFFYLTNLFGDVPLALTVDFNKTQRMPRTPQQEVYNQIIDDLNAAQSALPEDYSASGPLQERIRPNKWAATALLARVHLYLKNYPQALIEARAVIDQQGLFDLEDNLDNVFAPTSKEAIWQLKQTTDHPITRNATKEGNAFIPSPWGTGPAFYCITDQLLDAFEPNDKRRIQWIDQTDNSTVSGMPPGITWFPHKYKLGLHNSVPGMDPSEYYTGLRLAEMYLIHAEAQANGAGGGPAAAIDDLNKVRQRADIDLLPEGLTEQQVKAAVEKERQTELFAEWGHRWLDLKRTGKAASLLSQIPLKQPWKGDDQLLYPIPPSELRVNSALKQNKGY